MNRSTRIAPWRLVVFISALSVIFLWPTWVSLNELWLESTGRYTHGYLIVLISMYLMYQLRQPFETEDARPLLLALVPLSMLMFVWLIAILGSIQAIHQLVLPAIMWTLCLTVVGWALAKRFILPFAYLYLAIPIWEIGNSILQWLTVKAVESILYTFRIPAFIDGNFVMLPAGSFEIAGGCSGLHYFTIGLAISVLYSTLYLRTARHRIILVSVAIVLALLTNWIRVFIVVYAGHVSNMQHYLVTENHYYFGWVLFVIAMIPFALVGGNLERRENGQNDANLESGGSSQPADRTLITAALTGCAMLLIAVTGTIYAKIPELPPHDVVIELPEETNEWEFVQTVERNWDPHFVGHAAEAFGAYRNGESLVNVYANVYHGQTQGRELIGYENRIEGIRDWSIIEFDTTSLELSAGQALRFKVLKLKSDSESRRLAYYWYEVGGERYLGRLQTKLIYGLKLIFGRPDAGVTIVSASCEISCDSAQKAIEDWIRMYSLVFGQIVDRE